MITSINVLQDRGGGGNEQESCNIGEKKLYKCTNLLNNFCNLSLTKEYLIRFVDFFKQIFKVFWEIKAGYNDILW